MPKALLAVVCVAGVVASIAFAQAPPVLPPPMAPGAADAPRAAPPARDAPPVNEPSVVVRTQTGAEVRGGEAPASRWQAELERLDADLRLRLLTANEPRTAWLAGDLETTDIEAQVRHFADARIAAPDERLYLASLGVACLQPVRPSLAPCDAVDRLADWARRDGDNGVPMLLLAGRARQRGEADLAASFVEQAARAPRFDDYWSQGAARWWSYLRAYDAGVDPAAKAKAAANYASMRDLAWARANTPADARATWTDVTSAYATLSVMGPNARDLLQALTPSDLSDAALPFGTSRLIEIGYALVRATRITYVGELGYELYIPTEFARGVYDAIHDKSERYGLRHAGYHAMDCLRLEKGYRHWGHDIGIEDTPLEQDAEHRQGRSAGQRVPAKGRGVRAGAEGFCDRRRRQTGADRDATAQSLGQGHDVRLHAQLLVREQGSGSAHAGLDFVENQ